MNRWNLPFGKPKETVSSKEKESKELESPPFIEDVSEKKSPEIPQPELEALPDAQITQEDSSTEPSDSVAPEAVDEKAPVDHGEDSSPDSPSASDVVVDSPAVDNTEQNQKLKDIPETSEERNASVSENSSDIAPDVNVHSNTDSDLAEITQILRGLKRDFESKIKFDQKKNDQIDTLHKELQEYKDDIYHKMLQPVLMEMIQAIDQWNKLIDSYREKSVKELDPLKMLRVMESFPEDLVFILNNQGVDVHGQEESVFDPFRQKTNKRIPSDNPAENKRIAKRVRPGYDWNGKVLRKEIVDVYIHEQHDARHREQ